VSEVRPRSRKTVAARVREIQGMLAMHGLESETETTEQELETVTAEPPTPTRSFKATTTTELRPLPYRSVLAAWPDEWRERWGRRANELEEAGFSWRDAESRSFLEVWNQWRLTAKVVERN
jgi:hypothetical protein